MALSDNNLGKKARKESIVRLEDAVSRDPASHHLYLLGNLYLYDRQYERAEKLYDQVLNAKPKDYHALYRKGVVREKQGNTKEALDFFAEALKAVPDSSLYQQSFQRALKVIDEDYAKEKATEVIAYFVNSPSTALLVSQVVNKVFSFTPHITNYANQDRRMLDDLVAQLDACVVVEDPYSSEHVQAEREIVKADIRFNFGAVEEGLQGLEQMLQQKDDKKTLKLYTKLAFTFAERAKAVGQRERAQRYLDRVAEWILELIPDNDEETQDDEKPTNSVFGDWIISDLFKEHADLFQGSEIISQARVRQSRKLAQVAQEQGDVIDYENIGSLAESAFKEREYDAYCRLKVLQGRHFLELDDQEKALAVAKDVVAYTRDFRKLPKGKKFIEYVHAIRFVAEVDPDYNYKTSIRKVVRLAGKYTSKHEIGQYLKPAFDFLTDVDDHTTFSRIVEENLHPHIKQDAELQEMRYSVIPSENGANEVSALVSSIGEVFRYLDKEFLVAVAQRVEALSFFEETASERDILEEIGKWYVALDLENDADRVIERLKVAGSRGFKKSDSYYSLYDPPIPDHIKALGSILEILEVGDSFGSYTLVINTCNALIEGYQRALDFRSVKGHYVPDEPQYRFNVLEDERRKLDSMIYFETEKHTSEQIWTAIKRVHEIDEEKKALRSKGFDVITKEQYRGRISHLGWLIDLYKRQAEAYIKLKNPNEAMRNYKQIGKIAKEYGLMDYDGIHAVKMQNEILSGILVAMGDAQTTVEIAEHGIVIPGYVITRKLGEGKSGRVYLAQKEHSHIPRKIKIYKPEVEDPRFQDRRERRGIANIVINEADALARLEHPNLVRYYDHGLYKPQDQSGETLYVVSEYIDGTTVEAVLPELCPHDKAFVFNGIAAGLHHIHSAGFLLRDLKLNNVLRSRDGKVVKIDDFETIVRIEDAKQQHYPTQLSDRYRAPELVQGEEPTRESDYYALGACLLYLLQGRVGGLERITTLPKNEYDRELGEMIETCCKGFQYYGVSNHMEYLPLDPNPVNEILYTLLAYQKEERHDNRDLIRHGLVSIGIYNTPPKTSEQRREQMSKLMKELLATESDQHDP